MWPRTTFEDCRQVHTYVYAYIHTYIHTNMRTIYIYICMYEGSGYICADWFSLGDESLGKQGVSGSYEIHTILHFRDVYLICDGVHELHITPSTLFAWISSRKGAVPLRLKKLLSGQWQSTRYIMFSHKGPPLPVKWSVRAHKYTTCTQWFMHACTNTYIHIHGHWLSR